MYAEWLNAQYRVFIGKKQRVSSDDSASFMEYRHAMMELLYFKIIENAIE